MVGASRSIDSHHPCSSSAFASAICCRVELLLEPRERGARGPHLRVQGRRHAVGEAVARGAATPPSAAPPSRTRRSRSAASGGLGARGPSGGRSVGRSAGRSGGRWVGRSAGPSGWPPCAARACSGACGGRCAGGAGGTGASACRPARGDARTPPRPGRPRPSRTPRRPPALRPGPGPGADGWPARRARRARRGRRSRRDWVRSPRGSWARQDDGRDVLILGRAGPGLDRFCQGISRTDREVGRRWTDIARPGVAAPTTTVGRRRPGGGRVGRSEVRSAGQPA